MTTSSKLKSTAFVMMGALAGGIAAPHLMSGSQDQTLPIAFDMSSKRLIVEMVIGATDGLLSTGWENAAIENRVDDLRTSEHRVEIDAFEGVRANAFEEAVAGRWTETGLNSYLNALYIASDHLYPIAIMASTSQRSVTDLISENHDWMVGKPSDLIGLSRLLELETEIQARSAGLSEEQIWSTVPLIGVQAYTDTPFALYQGFTKGMDDAPAPTVVRARVEIPELGSVVVRDPFSSRPETDQAPSL